MEKPVTKKQWFFLAETGVALGAIALACEIPAALYFKLLSPSLALVLGVVSSFVGIVFIVHWIFRPLKDERRSTKLYMAMLAGNTSILPLADPQPIPDETALSLPCTFKLRRNW